MKLLYRSVYADIEGLVFNSLESLNAAIFESLSAFNGRRMSGRPLYRRERVGQTDNVLLLYLRKVAELKKYPPAAFRSCKGIMALEKTFGLERLVAASAYATQLRQYRYQEIRQILERGDDADFLSKDDIDDEVPVTSTHKNIRGAAYFAKSKHLNKNNNGNK